MITEINGTTTESVLIGTNSINSHKISLLSGSIYRVIVISEIISSGTYQQDFGMKFWISTAIAGPLLLGPTGNPNIFSLSKWATQLYLAEETADTSNLPSTETEIIDPDTGLVSIHSRGNSPLHHSGIWLTYAPAGNAYLNVQNYLGTENKYKLLITNVE